MEKPCRLRLHSRARGGYAFVSYQTAYLKAHYPQEFMAALMSLEMGDTNKTYKNIAECRLQDIPVLPPDVTRAMRTSRSAAKRFASVSALYGVGSKAIEAIQVARQEGTDGPFTDFL
jgi:DNA polymerase-3 subunit alpha